MSRTTQKLLLSVAVMIGAIALSAHDAAADRVSIKGNSPSELKGKCDQAGGVFFPPGGSTGAYGCLAKSGGGVVCGGATKEYQNTCDTFKQPAPNGRLPNRDTLSPTRPKNSR